MDKGLTGRVRVICSLSVLLVIIYIVYLVSAVMLTPDSRERYRNARVHALSSVNVEGDIVDRRGRVISSAAAVGKAGVCEHLSFSYLIGKYSASGQNTGSGLRSRFAGYLFDAEKEGEKGNTIYLTLDADLNNYCHELACEYQKCSILVMDSRTAAVYALVNHNEEEYDVNAVSSEIYNRYNSIDKFWIPLYTYHEAPGSTFKIVTASLILDHNLQNEQYYDNGVMSAGNIHNYSNAAYGSVDLDKAFVKSINTYFASIGVKIGSSAMEERASDFLIGEEIKLDFARLRSNIELGTDEKLAATAFGQGGTLISPVHLAMICQSIANDGEMMKPYTVDRIESTSGKVVYETEPEVLNQCVSAETANGVKQLMRMAAKSYGLHDYIYAKSGTAEIAENGSCYNHAYLLTFSENYVVLVSVNETALAGSQLSPAVNSIYSYLSNNFDK